MVERVVVEDVVPASHRVLNVAPLALLDDRTLRWQLDRLRPGEEQTLNVELQPDGEGSIETTSTVRAYAAVSFQTEVAGPRLKLEVISPERVAVGQPFPIRYRITNTGAAAAEHVLLREDLPSELTHRDGRRLDCDLGTLEPGETREALLTAMAATPGATAHQVKVQADGGSADEVERSVLIAEAPARREVPVERPPEPRPPVRRPPPRPEPRPPVRPPSPPPVFCVPAPHCCP